MSWTCQCPREIVDTVPVCGSCMQDRPISHHAATSTLPKCADCSEPIRPMLLTTGYDENHRCNACHMEYLRQRTTSMQDPNVVQSRSEFHQHLKRGEWKWRSRRGRT